MESPFWSVIHRKSIESVPKRRNYFFPAKVTGAECIGSRESSRPVFCTCMNYPISIFASIHLAILGIGKERLCSATPARLKTFEKDWFSRNSIPQPFTLYPPCKFLRIPHRMMILKGVFVPILRHVKLTRSTYHNAFSSNSFEFWKQEYAFFFCQMFKYLNCHNQVKGFVPQSRKNSDSVG